MDSATIREKHLRTAVIDAEQEVTEARIRLKALFVNPKATIEGLTHAKVSIERDEALLEMTKAQLEAFETERRSPAALQRATAVRQHIADMGPLQAAALKQLDVLVQTLRRGADEATMFSKIIAEHRAHASSAAGMHFFGSDSIAEIEQQQDIAQFAAAHVDTLTAALVAEVRAILKALPFSVDSHLKFEEYATSRSLSASQALQSSFGRLDGLLKGLGEVPL